MSPFLSLRIDLHFKAESLAAIRTRRAWPVSFGMNKNPVATVIGNDKAKASFIISVFQAHIGQGCGVSRRGTHDQFFTHREKVSLRNNRRRQLSLVSACAAQPCYRDCVLPSDPTISHDLDTKTDQRIFVRFFYTNDAVVLLPQADSMAHRAWLVQNSQRPLLPLRSSARHFLAKLEELQILPWADFYIDFLSNCDERTFIRQMTKNRGLLFKQRRPMCQARPHPTPAPPDRIARSTDR